jgi:hypothetical protein
MIIMSSYDLRPVPHSVFSRVAAAQGAEWVALTR